jgi:hypothetical protein
MPLGKRGLGQFSECLLTKSLWRKGCATKGVDCDEEREESKERKQRKNNK